MAYRFSQHSQRELGTLHPQLREILETVIVTDDFRVDQGGRTPDEQQAMFEDGRTTLPGYVDGHPNPKANHLTHEDGWSYAADIWPYVGGRRVNVPEWAEIERRVQAGDARQWLQDAVGAYAQFSWLMRKVKEVAYPILEAHRQITNDRYVVRFGLDWDGDGEILTDQGFDDYPHVELRRA